MQKTKPEYKELKFTDKFEFIEWLRGKSRYIVHFEDQGQDLTMMYIDAGGEVLNVRIDPLARVFNGKIVNIKSLKQGGRVQFYRTSEAVKYQIEKVEIREVALT